MFLEGVRKPGSKKITQPSFTFSSTLTSKRGRKDKYDVLFISYYLRKRKCFSGVKNEALEE